MLEVSTPLLAATTVTDPHIASFEMSAAGQTQYLQTSPEFAMKKLLANGSGPIYSLGSVFRAGESGAFHRSEFTMLEWYRPGFSLADLQTELSEMIRRLTDVYEFSFPEPRTERYRDLFEQCFGVNPHVATIDELRDLARDRYPDLLGHLGYVDKGERNDLLDLLFSQGVQPTLVEPHFVIEFPESQASLAKTGVIQDSMVALRTELYWQGHELANGYDELRDSSVLRQRTELDNEIRRSRGLPLIAADEALLAAIGAMPGCSGIAVGIDRLLMVLAGETRLPPVPS